MQIVATGISHQYCRTLTAATRTAGAEGPAHTNSPVPRYTVLRNPISACLAENRAYNPARNVTDTRLDCVEFWRCNVL